MRNLKLIWDFRGPDALRTAQHHEIHLKEYVVVQNVAYLEIGFEAISEMYAIAFIAVKENNMPPIRDALKPHRGELYNTP